MNKIMLPYGSMNSLAVKKIRFDIFSRMDYFHNLKTPVLPRIRSGLIINFMLYEKDFG